jgi:hypothetical protein
MAALTETVGLLGAPSAPLRLLTSTQLPADSEHVARVAGRARLRAARSALAAEPVPGWLDRLRPWQWVWPAAVAVYLAGRALEAQVAHPAVTEDVVGYGVLSLVAAGAATWRGRRDRRSRPAAEEPAAQEH